jgi:hypothetical protein
MVDVKWDLQGGNLNLQDAEESVGKVLTFYRETLAGITCPAHQQEARLVVKGRTVRELVVSLEVCCDELLKRINARVGSVSRRGEE